MRGKIDDLGKVSVTVEEEDYDNSKFYYENTIVVDSDLGICCISIRPVPPGIPITDTRFWKCITRLETSIMLKYRRMTSELAEIKQMIKSLSSAGGVALSNMLGSNDVIGMSQRAITDNFLEVRKRLSDLEGTNESNFTITITPEFVTNMEKNEIVVHCTSDEPFDSIKVYFNGELKIDKADVIDYTYIDSIEDTTDIRVECILDGKFSIQTKTIKYYPPFFVGSGNIYEDIVKEENIVNYRNNPSGTYSVNCSEGDYIFVIVGKYIDKLIDTININSSDNMTKEEECSYVVYKSENTYSAGNQEININV